MRNINNQNHSFFDLELGSSSETIPIGVHISGDDLSLFKKILGTTFEDLNLMKLKNVSRVRILK